MEPETRTKPQVETIYTAEAKCYMCGTVAGSVESSHTPIPRSVLFRRNGQAEALPLLDWRRLRCERCKGPIFLDDADVVTRRHEEYNWLEERPRRGRPPKRLVEERRRQEAALLESQAA